MSKNDLLYLKLNKEEAQIILCGILTMFTDWDERLKKYIKIHETEDALIVRCILTQSSVHNAILHAKQYLALILLFADYLKGKLEVEHEETLNKAIDGAQNRIDCLNQIYDEMTKQD